MKPLASVPVYLALALIGTVGALLLIPSVVLLFDTSMTLGNRILLLVVSSALTTGLVISERSDVFEGRKKVKDWCRRDTIKTAESIRNRGFWFYFSIIGGIALILKIIHNLDALTK